MVTRMGILTAKSLIWWGKRSSARTRRRSSFSSVMGLCGGSMVLSGGLDGEVVRVGPSMGDGGLLDGVSGS